MIDIRFGHGFDVHQFTDGNQVRLCGVDVPHTHALKGHSDADVGLHAITDALYGAMGAGDIGQHFPPSDPKWKGQDSAYFLQQANDMLQNKGGQILNIDITLICEQPKIGPHADQMKQTIAKIVLLDEDKINVKATTTETLGFTGRGEGIAALATAAVIFSKT